MNDKGSGNGSSESVLDLSSISFAYLSGIQINSITNGDIGLIDINNIHSVSSDTESGPVINGKK